MINKRRVGVIMMTNTIITISRQFGSGGRTIGKLVSEQLGLKCYDGEIISEISKKSGFTEDYIKENSESVGNGLFSSLANVGFYGQSSQLTLWNAQCNVIRSLANEDCVIVGRCADYVLKNTENVDLLRVYIYADLEFRADRIVKQYGESDVNPKKRLNEKDKRRAAYYEIYTDQKFGDPLNYDLCLNSSSLSIERCVELIVEEYKRKKK